MQSTPCAPIDCQFRQRSNGREAPNVRRALAFRGWDGVRSSTQQAVYEGGQPWKIRKDRG
jgi:hypothetical protein